MLSNVKGLGHLRKGHQLHEIIQARKALKELSNNPNVDLSDVFRRLYTSPKYFSELLLKIKTKKAEIRPLIYNRAQRYLYHVVQQLRLSRTPVRVIVVKARQLGLSTGISSLVYQHTATRSNVTSLVSSHDIDSSNNIYGMYRMFYDYTDDYFKPMTKYSNRKEVVFENPNDAQRKKSPGLNSRILVDTASNVKVGRSFTIHNCHLSEVAFMDNAEELMIGIEQAVPYLSGTSVFLESTANGLGNFFHKKSMLALDKKGQYILVFIPWFWDEDYKVMTQEVKIKTLGSTEKDEYGNEQLLFDELHLNLEQLQWRRNKIDGAFDGNVQKFYQEYPSTVQEAFIFSGQSMFPAKLLVAMKEQCAPPLYRAEVLCLPNLKFQKRVHDRGELSIWAEPVQGETYVIGADPSEGIEGGNNSIIDVIDVRKMEQVAQWAGLIPPDELAEVIYYLGKEYFDALVGIEVNNHGLTTVVALQKLHYWNQYRRKIFDRIRKTRRDALGWRTTGTTKPLVIDGLRQVVKDGEIVINERETISEMLTYVKLDSGQLGASPGQKDDRVMSLAVAVEMSRQAFVRSKIAPKEKKPFLTMERATQMADEIYEQRKRPGRIGSWHQPLEG